MVGHVYVENYEPPIDTKSIPNRTPAISNTRSFEEAVPPASLLSFISLDKPINEEIENEI